MAAARRERPGSLISVPLTHPTIPFLTFDLSINQGQGIV